MPAAFIPAETLEGETRVAATPESAKRLAGLGLAVEVERGAGVRAGFPDGDYEEAGAALSDAGAWGAADLVLKVQPPEADEAARLKRGAVLVSFVVPSSRPELVRALADGGVTSFAMDLVPRITRAQSMDALSSQATVAGYKAVLLGASHLRRMCPLLMTAAGTVTPARVVVFGAGVAGLQAIATAKRLGCVVEATDVRLAAREQVLSLGGRFIEVPGMEDLEGEGGYAKQASEELLRRQREEVAKRVAEADLVITTAQVPGRAAPRLVGAEMVRSMKAGSVIVDLAVESGGNCELSRAGEVCVEHGVTIVGTKNLAATVPATASDLYAKNVFNLVKLFAGKEGLPEDYEDEVLVGCLLTHKGDVRHGPTAELLGMEKVTP
jgi:proton-translocating NAD(P)+ transhydrogenase subunit alpha